MRLKTFLSVLVFAVCASAQSTLVRSTSGTTSATAIAGSSGDAVFFTPAIGAWSNWGSTGIPAEERKAVGPVPTWEQVKATGHLIQAGDLAPATYASLALRIGLRSAATDEARVLDAIHALELTVYDYAPVDKYLYRQALKQGTNVRWVWKPLRESDKAVSDKNFTWTTQPNFGFLYSKLYAKAIPARVLARVASILDELPDAVFLVSDYEVIKPDPFLAISTPALLAENKLWIIEQWNEPGFRDGPDVEPAKLVSRASTVQ